MPWSGNRIYYGMSKSYFFPILCYDFHRILCSSMTSAKGGEGEVSQILIFDDRGGCGDPKRPKKHWRHTWTAPNSIFLYYSDFTKIAATVSLWLIPHYISMEERMDAIIFVPFTNPPTKHAAKQDILYKLFVLFYLFSHT